MARHFKESTRDTRGRKTASKSTHASDSTVVAEADRLPDRQADDGYASGGNAPRRQATNSYVAAPDTRPVVRRGVRVVPSHNNTGFLWRSGLALSGLTYALGVTLCLLGFFGLLHKPLQTASPLANQTDATPAATSADTSSPSTSTAPANQETKGGTTPQKAESASVSLAGGGFTFAVPAALAENGDFELPNSGDNGLVFMHRGTSAIFLYLFSDLSRIVAPNVDNTDWGWIDENNAMETRDVASGTLQIHWNEPVRSTGSIHAFLTAQDGRRLYMLSSYCANSLNQLEDRLDRASLTCQADVCGMSADGDPLRIAIEFLVTCANGITFDAMSEPNAQPAQDSAAASSNAGSEAKTFIAASYRFNVPEYWQGKVDILEDGDSVTIRLSGVPKAKLVTVDWEYDPSRYENWWYEASQDSSAVHYALPNGSEALCGGSMRAAGGVAQSIWRFVVTPGAYMYMTTSDLAGIGLDEGARERVEDLMSFGTGSRVDDSGRLKAFVELWGSVVRSNGEPLRPIQQETAESEAKPAESEPADTDSESTSGADEADDAAADEMERSEVSSRTSEFYGVWADSSKDYAYAVWALEEAQQQGFDAKLFITDDWDNLSKKTKGWYVITLVCADSEDEADEVLDRAKEAGYDDAYVKWTGTYVGS